MTLSKAHPRRHRLAALAVLVLLSGPQAAFAQPAETPATAKPESLGIEITYTGNEGFLMAVGGKKILIDALYREGVSGYVVPSTAQREQMEGAQPPFDAIDLVLATHYDADHYHPDAIVSHLRSDPKAIFVSTKQAATALERAAAGAETVMDRVQGYLPAEGESKVLEIGGVGLEVMNLHHGRRRNVENAGFQITIGERKLLHLGDTEAVLGELRRYDLPARNLDVIFVPFWYLLGDTWKSAAREQLKAAHLVVMHLPAPDAGDEYINSLGGWEKVARDILAAHPNAMIFRKPMDSVRF